MKTQLLTLTAFAAITTVASASIIKIENGGTAIDGVTPGGFTLSTGSLTSYTTIDCGGGTVTLTSDNEYILDNITFVENGVLEIEAGTIIRGEPVSSSSKNDPGALVITRTARINAQGTNSDPIIFTTAAVDNDSDGIADGVSVTLLNSGTEGAYIVKSATQWTSGDLFLDADPKNSPLAPTVGFATRTPGVSPVLISKTYNAEDDENYWSGYLELDSENRSLWGGVIILGSAPTSIGLVADGGVVGTNKGDLEEDFLDDVFEGFIEGLNLAEVGESGVYGGMNPNDNSGVMQYVSIRHGGSGIGYGNEINGLTMGGVGRGTLIENIEVYANGDDGYEWFGGTVDTKYLISLWNNDDSFDIDEGFTGRGQFWFSLQGDDTINGDHGGEHDGTDANHDSVDLTDFGTDDSGLGLVPAYITVYNATYIGGGANGNVETDSAANRALRIRDGFNGEYYNSIFSDFKDTPLRDDDVDNTGYFTVNNSIFAGVDGAAYADVAALLKSGALKTNWTVDNATVDEDPFDVRRNGKSNPFGDDVLAAWDRTGNFDGDAGFDPRPDTSTVAPTDDLATTPATFFTSASYKGAFSPIASDATIWTGSSASTTNQAWSVFALSFLDLQ
jgi:hypothetical protein